MTPETGVPDEPLQYVAARVREAIAEDPRTHVLDVDVRVVGEDVFLRGQVPSEERRQAIEDVAREFVGDRHVHNEVAVFVPRAGEIEEVT